MKTSSKRPFAVYWNNIPAPYMIDRFNALVGRNNIEFEAWFNERTEPDRRWKVDESQWNFNYRYLRGLNLLGNCLHFPFPLFPRTHPDILVSLYAEPIFLIGWMIARLRGSKTAFWVEKTFDTWVSRRAWKETIKRQIFSRVDGIITAGRDGRDYAIQYSAPIERIHYAPHVIDVNYYKKRSAEESKRRIQIRNELNLKGVTFIYVGRLWRGKGIKYLLNAFNEVQNRIAHEVSLMIVGDGEDENSLKKQCNEKGIRNVIFTGFCHKLELPKLYTAADVFVFPTLGDPYGLVVDEAMACSLPVISTAAVGEISTRVEDWVNGFVVPPNNSVAIAEKLELLVDNVDLRKQMGKASAEKIAGNTPERWAQNFENAVKRILQLPQPN